MDGEAPVSHGASAYCGDREHGTRPRRAGAFASRRTRLIEATVEAISDGSVPRLVETRYTLDLA